MPTYRDILSRLAPHYDSGEARAILRLVMESRFGMPWTDVLCGGIDALSDGKLQELEGIVCRLEQSEPVQYVLGEAEFCGRMFAVAPGVLIPRPETEELVAEASVLGDGAKTVLDIGTGSGCIALTLALEHPDWQVVGWDISPDALQIARGNARKLGVENIVFEQMDILNPAVGTDRKWDLIVSNPPYICQNERADMEKHVLQHEPETALFVPDDDPLLFYRAIADYGKLSLADGGRLLFEINRRFGRETVELLRAREYNNVYVKADQFGNDRIAGGTL